MDAPKCRTCGEKHWPRAGCAATSSRGSRVSRPALPSVRQASPDSQLVAPKAAGIGAREAGVAPSPREAKRGRPLDVDKDKTLTAIKPWIAAGLSRATWYRRRAERAKQ